MASTKRKKVEREADLVVIARLYLQQKNTYEIAEYINSIRDYNISRGQIHYDLSDIFKRWQRSTMMDFDRHKAMELERLNMVEKAYWEAYERSCQETEVFRREQVEDKSGKQNVPYSRDKATIERRQRDGDPRYLKGIMDCIDKRCELLGLTGRHSIAAERAVRDWRSEAEKEGYESAGEVYEQLVAQFIEQDSDPEMGRPDGSGSLGGSPEDQEGQE